MEKTLGVADNTLNFKNAHLYLDDYVTSQANDRPVPQFQDQLTTNAQIQNYYRLYSYEGLYGTDFDLSRVAGNHFFTYVLTSMYGKYRTAKGELTNDHYENLKYSQFIGNENAMIGAIKLLNDKDSEPIYPPKFGSSLRFELYEQDGLYYVKVTNNGHLVNLKGERDGTMPYEEFMDMIYKLLYFGDVDKYCIGQESASGKDRPRHEKYEEYIWGVNPDLKNNFKRVDERKNQFVEQSFVELKKEPEVRVIEESRVISVPSSQSRPMYIRQNNMHFSSAPRDVLPVQSRYMGKFKKYKIDYRRTT
jgi:hypothetical protein